MLKINALVCLVTATALILPSCGKKEEKVVREVVRPVKLMTIKGGQEISRRELPGTVRASQRVDLAFKVAGPLVEFPVVEGQEVEVGQLIARILPRDFETDLAKKRAKSLEAEQQFQRYKELYIRRQVSKADFDKYKSQYDIARAREKESRDALEDTYLRAPFPGVIARTYVENFQEVKAKEPIVSLQDITNIEILVNVPEAMIARVRKKTPLKVTVRFDTAPGREFPLALKEYSTQADSRTQTYQVTFQMKQPGGVNILPGMTATVVGSKTHKVDKKGQIIIPAVAVFSDQAGSPHVWVVDQNEMTVIRRKVVTGELTGSESIQIIEGLKVGETIAVTGTQQLREGVKVRPLSEVEGYGG